MASGLAINLRIQQLENTILNLEGKLKDLSTNTEEKDPTPYTIGSINKNPIQIADINTNTDGSIFWNDSELNTPPKFLKPPDPTKGYNKHFHTRYAGGALDINALEIVEYQIEWEGTEEVPNPTHSKHSQQFWGTSPDIKKVQNTKNELVDKIGNLDLVFDADSAKWGTGAYEIDIDKCYFVRRYPADSEEGIPGTIMLDENDKEMKAKIYNSDNTKTNIIWDKTALCWRWYSIYAETPPTP